MTKELVHPATVLLDAQGGAQRLPVCDHYSGVEARMRKSLQLQAEMMQEFGTCVFDVTLDCEDGAPVGQEAEHARLVVELANGAAQGARVAARVHAVEHAHFQADMDIIAGGAADKLCHIMIPKVESVDDVIKAEAALQRATDKRVPLHVLIESPAAVQQAFDIAAHPAVQSISFGLMDFVSAHGGAIPASAMTAQGQFEHPLVVRAKLEIAAACHAHGKVPSHCVVTEFKNPDALGACAQKASRELGYTRMWSIHPDQIRPILRAFAPAEDEVLQAAQILTSAAVQNWAPISFGGVLHDRASYRYFWQLLERAHQTGQVLPVEVQPWFAPASIR
ncbi:MULTISPECIES: CoA ester lyase [Comamonas]|uniref:Malyl-CoA lyase n=1 Tax=Comamonas testosteroni TaxID=285 RepID=A0A8B4S7B3_COMTE|nr:MULTISPECIES: aldolase/citrate lyase family protein [Comamonas]EFI62539.1 HpcH/HpaI aldolase [Comamonas thiooxydans]EHN66348.1 HpcH/HpaI aldolase [Comamonas testosteroni ATCC 11996]QQN67915.1 CoA ester lyase [Comamonas testosteroni]RDI05523.1 citrate lyase subunit beta/citryl-CoA lyase [Comamonas sp. AG1104]TFF55131.1 CoA ester lyase [Comamonas sp. A23]